MLSCPYIVTCSEVGLLMMFKVSPCVSCVRTMSEQFVVGVDVGTGSARAALISDRGNLINMAVHPIKTWNPKSGIYQQSSEDIWLSVCKVVQVHNYPYFKKPICFGIKTKNTTKLIF